MRDHPFAGKVLKWYDENARQLPWRIAPQRRAHGVIPDPYCVWLSEIMLQQTTVAAVTGYYHKFLARWPTVTDLASANDSDVMAEWAGLGYYARARNLLKCSREIAHQRNGRFPVSYAELLQLPGVGPYTAAAIAAICYDAPEPVVDGNIKRVLARVFAIQLPPDKALAGLMRHANDLTPVLRTGDYAQAMMDLGATVCTPKNPDCDKCPVAANCGALAQGIVHELPRTAPKPAKPTRHGTVYVARRTDGAWLLERRPPKGLLGGMLGWPGSDWADIAGDNPPFGGIWTAQNAMVRHTFTHFRLELKIQTAIAKIDAVPSAGHFVPAEEFHRDDLPTVMRKVFDAAAPGLSSD